MRPSLQRKVRVGLCFALKHGRYEQGSRNTIRESNGQNEQIRIVCQLAYATLRAILSPH